MIMQTKKAVFLGLAAIILCTATQPAIAATPLIQLAIDFLDFDQSVAEGEPGVACPGGVEIVHGGVIQDSGVCSNDQNDHLLCEIEKEIPLNDTTSEVHTIIIVVAITSTTAAVTFSDKGLHPNTIDFSSQEQEILKVSGLQFVHLNDEDKVWNLNLEYDFTKTKGGLNTNNAEDIIVEPPVSLEINCLQ